MIRPLTAEGIYQFLGPQRRRALAKLSQDDRYAPFEDDQHPCAQCGRPHFVFNSAGRIFCQRCGEPQPAQLAQGVFGTTTNTVETASCSCRGFLHDGDCPQSGVNHG